MASNEINTKIHGFSKCEEKRLPFHKETSVLFLALADYREQIFLCGLLPCGKWTSFFCREILLSSYYSGKSLQFRGRCYSKSTCPQIKSYSFLSISRTFLSYVSFLYLCRSFFQIQKWGRGITYRIP